MKGSLKYALVSIKYKVKRVKIKNRQLYDVEISSKTEIVIVINEEKRVVKFKSDVISRVCRNLGLNLNNVHEPNINSVEILKDMGNTNYDID
jgi:hypothetical protein